MAIDRTGISSLDAGALDITYSGDEGPKSPNQIAGGEYNRVLELLEKVREDIPLSEEEKIELQGLIRTLTAKGINVEALMGGDTRMASVDPMLQDEYDKYVFELQEMHPEAVPMTIEQFREQAISGMAEGGIARLGYQWGGPPGGGETSYGSGAATSGLGAAGGATGGGGGYSDAERHARRDPDPEPPSLGVSVHGGKQVGDINFDLLEEIKRQREEKEEEKVEVLRAKQLGDINFPGLLGVGLNFLKGPFQKGSTATRNFFLDKVLPAQRGMFKGINIYNLTNKEQEELYKEYMKARMAGDIDAYGNPSIGGDRDDQPPIIYPYPLQASAPVDEIETAEWEAPEIPTERLRLYSADGGRIPAAYGGIMGDDGRRRYGLGSIFKKAARGIKKVLKSPVGKAALIGLGGYWLGGGQLLGGSRMFGDKFGSSFALDNLMKRKGIKQLFTKKGEGTDWDPWKLGIGAASLYPLIAGMGDDDDEDFTQTDLYKRWLAQKQAADIQFAPVGDPANWQRQRLYADGGRIGYAGGGYYDEDEEDHRAAALAAMYRRGAQEGGLMDMGGMEKDYRQEGGFVPIGGQERADDVPARLSKNEFVFTADAVRAAGGGDIDAGAEVMENVMENLEQGGQVSEESQGLEGARNMFATAQRLEGVL